MSKGILIVSGGQKWLNEAERLKETIKENHPGIKIAHLARHEPFKKKSEKIALIRSSPFHETIFLDTDCAIVDPQAFSLFDLLEKFDVAAAHAPRGVSVANDSIPDCFPEFNSGVIAFKKNARTRSLLLNWEIEADNCEFDEPAFRTACWRSLPELRLGVFPPAWNYRDNSKLQIPRGSVRIYHHRTQQRRAVSSLH